MSTYEQLKLDNKNKQKTKKKDIKNNSLLLIQEKGINMCES